MSRIMSPAEILATTAERVAGLSAEQVEALRRGSRFVLDLVADVMGAPAADRAERYALAVARGRTLGMVVDDFPAVMDSDAERFLLGMATAANAIEVATQQPTALH